MQELDYIKVLLDERKQTGQLAVDINQRIFHTIAAIVIPVIVVLGYAFLNYNSEIKFIILVIPFIVIVVAFLVGALFTELYVAGNYVRYLSCLLNPKLPTTPLLFEKLWYDFVVKGFSLQTAFLVLSAIFFCAVDILCLILASKLLVELMTKITEFCCLKENQKTMIQCVYWTSVCILHLFLFISFLIQYYFKAKKLKETIANRNWQI